MYCLGSLISLVGGVVWCYLCWDPARFVLLHFVIPFHLFTFYLRPHAMLLVLQLGFRMGNPRVRFFHTVPVAGNTLTRPVILVVWFETRSYLSLKYSKYSIKCTKKYVNMFK